jgi:hypothetical protein
MTRSVVRKAEQHVGGSNQPSAGMPDDHPSISFCCSQSADRDFEEYQSASHTFGNEVGQGSRHPPPPSRAIGCGFPSGAARPTRSKALRLLTSWLDRSSGA